MVERAPDLSEDRAWCAAYKRGDRAAFERVFRAYAGLVATILERGARSKDGASFAPGVSDAGERDDLLHDVFLRAFEERTRHSYDGLRPYAPFIAQIARHTLFDVARKRGRLAQRTVDVAPDDEAFTRAVDTWEPARPLPDSVAISNEERAIARAFVATLEGQERGVVEVRFEGGASQVETADRLGISRQQIRTLEGKIREKFQRFIAGSEKT